MYTRSLRIIKTKEPYTYTLVQLIFWTLVWFVHQKVPVESQKRILYFIDYTKKLIEVLNSYNTCSYYSCRTADKRQSCHRR